MSVLDDFVAECSTRKFDWRTWNCGHMAEAWVQRYEGTTVALMPDAYAQIEEPSQLTVARVTRLLGGADALATLALQRSPIFPTFAAVGDLVYFGKHRSAGIFGICNGRTAFVLADPVGMTTVLMDGAEAAWRLTRVQVE